VPFYEPGTYIKDMSPDSAIDVKGPFNFGFAIQASYNFTDWVGVQLEGVYSTEEINIDVSGDNVAIAKGALIQFPILVKIGGACSPVAYQQPCIRFHPPTAVLS
jgi:hypothetical protein